MPIGRAFDASQMIGTAVQIGGSRARAADQPGHTTWLGLRAGVAPDRLCVAGCVIPAVGRCDTASMPGGGPHPRRQGSRPAQFPCHGWEENNAWLEAVLAAADLVCWAKLICFAAGPPRDRRLPLPGAARGRPAHPLRPPHLPAHRPRLAVGRPDRRRLPPPARRLRLTSPYRVLTITGRRQPAHQQRRCPRRGIIPALATARTQTAPAHSHPPTRNQDQIGRAAGGSEAA
jgi:hypothetical protein